MDPGPLRLGDASPRTSRHDLGRTPNHPPARRSLRPHGRASRVAALPLLLAACQLTVTPTPCASDAACRDAFGVGTVCGDAGYCEEVTLPPRCEVWPANALEDPDAIWLGAQYDYASDYVELLASQLAFDQANARTGLDGRSFALIACDSSEDPAFDDLDPVEATEAISLFQAEAFGVPAVIGAEYSSRAERAYSVLSGFGTLVLSPGASSPSLTSIDGLVSTDADPGLFWRTIPSDTDQGRVVAREIDANLGGGQVAVLAQAGAYGEGFAQVFLQDYDPGNERTSLRLFADATDLSTAIVAIGQEAPDVVLLITGSPSDAVGFLNAAAAIPAYADMPLFFTDGPKTSELLETVTPAAASLFPNVRGTFPRTPTGRTTYQVFAAGFRLTYDGYDPDADSYTPYCYDAGWLAAYGAAWSLHQEGGITGVGMARGLRRLSDGPALDVGPEDWSAVTSQFRDGQGINIDGASGSLDFDPVTGETSAAVDIWFVDETAGFTIGYCWDLSSSPDPACTGGPG
jgi:ABC-type branched-subunit amino acid transport system substrate-binding protein